jgi:hypothetical protein
VDQSRVAGVVVRSVEALVFIYVEGGITGCWVVQVVEVAAGVVDCLHMRRSKSRVARVVVGSVKG